MNSADRIAEVAEGAVVDEGSVFTLDIVSEERRWSRGGGEPVSHIPLHVAAVVCVILGSI